MVFASEVCLSQCKGKSQLYDCMATLGDYTFARSYELDFKQSESSKQVSYIFSEKTMYLLEICEVADNSSNFQVTIYDSEGNFVATNYDKKKQKYYSDLGFYCQKTAVYYILFKYDSIKDLQDCSLVILTYK